MIELTASQLRALLPLFADGPHHAIARSCCLGLTPCRAFADDAQTPVAAVIVLKPFGIGFAAGDPLHAAELLDCLRGWHPWYEINDPPVGWHPALAAWSRESHATVRYGFQVDSSAFDQKKLRALAVPPPGCTIVRYDRALLDIARSEAWSEDQAGAFPTPEDFLREGFGVALLRDGRLLSGCASFCLHPNGYEIQVDTHPDERGKGYATCACAAFMLEALRQGRIPFWDAANPASLRLAEKLGFRLESAYVAWLLVSEQTTAEAVARAAVGA